MKHRWHITTCTLAWHESSDSEKLDALLERGWEPFAVTQNSSDLSYQYHLRKKEKIR